MRVSQEQQRKILRNITLQTTCTTHITDVQFLRYYYHSKVRICVQYPWHGTAEAWYMNGRRNLMLCGFDTVEQMIEWLEKNGAKKIPKPKSRKPLVSVYD